MYLCIGGFRGGVEGAAAPPFFLYFRKVLQFCFDKSFVGVGVGVVGMKCQSTVEDAAGKRG